MVQAQEGAATLLRETQSQVDELQARTEASAAERVVEVELLVANAEQEARVESERIVAEAIAAGEAIITRAKDEGRALLDQVQEARRRVLSDLAARRRGLGIQIEQLRAARDEMAASVHGVRDRVDGILAHLDRTDEEARAAAQGVADQFRLGTAEIPHDQDETDEAAGRRRRRGRPRPWAVRPAARRGRTRPHPRSTSSSPASGPGRRRQRQPAPEPEQAAPAATEDVAGGGTERAEPAKADAGSVTDRSGARRGRRRGRDRGRFPGGRRRRGARGRTGARRLHHHPARRVADADHGAAEPRHQAHTGGRPEPAARPPAERAGARDRRAHGLGGRARGDLRVGGAQPPRRGVRRRDDLRRSRRGDHPEGRCRGAIVRRAGARAW